MMMLMFLLFLSLTTGGESAEVNHHLIGGKSCAKNERHHQVWVFNKSPSARSFCGGTLIDKYWVMTAAHCYNKSRIGNISVWAGVHPYREFQIFNIKSGDIHVYDETKKTGDIMLLKLPGAVSGITPAQLPASSCKTPANGEVLQIAGHGSTTNQTGPSDRTKPLQCLDLKVTNCCRHTSNFFCGEGLHKKPSAYTCKGDSGGGWLKKRPGRTGVIYGVHHGVYKMHNNTAISTSVCAPPIREWIHYIMNNH